MFLKLLTLFFLLLAPTEVFSAKIYIWLHCKEEEKEINTWQSFMQDLTSSNGYLIEYSLNNSIPKIAEMLYQTKIKSIEENNDIIIIGHSMAGLVARSLQQLSPQIKGIIIIGTPNQGSTLLQHLLNGVEYDYFSKAIRMVNIAMDKSLLVAISAEPPLSVIIRPLQLPINTFKKDVVKALNDLKVNYQKDMSVYASSYQCIRDMLPNSNYLNNINATSPNIPILNIYGSEDYWQVIRTLGALKSKADKNQKLNQDKSYDIEFVEKIQNGFGLISQIQNTHTFVYNTLALPAILNPTIWQRRELVHGAKCEWDVVYRYLETGIHADFANNMGAVEYRLQNYCLPEKLAINKSSNTLKYLPYILENDGFLSKNDALLLSGVNIHNIKVRGVNNKEMGNHSEMRNLLDGIINLSTYGEIFAK